MASGPITSCQIDGETMETVRDFIFGGSKITADSDCSHKIKRCLLLGRKAMINLTSVQFSCSVMSDSLWPHGLQQSRPPCPSPTPRAYPNSCPLSRWCHPTSSSSVVYFSSCPNPSQYWGGQSIGVSASPSVLPMDAQDWSLLGWMFGSPCSQRDCQESHPTPQFKSINSLVLSFLYGPTLTSIYDYWKNYSFA